MVWWLLLLALIALIGTPAPAWATASLTFEGGGYWLELEIGDREAPDIARLRFHRPGDAQGVVLPMAAVTVERFDPGRKVLRLRHERSGPGDVPSFTLRVQQQRAELLIDGQRIVADFDWSM